MDLNNEGCALPAPCIGVAKVRQVATGMWPPNLEGRIYGRCTPVTIDIYAFSVRYHIS